MQHSVASFPRGLGTRLNIVLPLCCHMYNKLTPRKIEIFFLAVAVGSVAGSSCVCVCVWGGGGGGGGGHTHDCVFV